MVSDMNNLAVKCRPVWLALGLLLLTACSDSAMPEVEALVYEQARPLSDFSLQDKMLSQ